MPTLDWIGKDKVRILKFMICLCMNIILNLKVSIAKPI